MVYVGFQSDKGMRRINNEDACFVLPKENVYIIADGVGGNKAGEIASNKAVKEVAQYIKENLISQIEFPEDLGNYFNDCIDKVNESILNFAKEMPENSGMATTLLICYIWQKKVFLANVGDSRAYLFRDDELFQITEDHTYVNSLVKLGVISPNEAKSHQRSHVITRAMGADKKIEADFYLTDAEEGDVVILCTDGLYGEVDEKEIAAMIKNEQDMSKLAKSFVAKANKAGGRDNITVVCLKLVGGSVNEQ